MKRVLLSVLAVCLLLSGCQKKETKPASRYANLPSLQSMKSKVRKGMSSADLRAALGNNFSGGSGDGTYREDGVRASNGTLVLQLQNDRLVTILALPKVKGTLKQLRPKIRTGMRPQAVWSVLGYPDRGSSVSIFGSGNNTYYVDDGMLIIIFEQGKVKDIRETPGAKNDIGMP